MVRVFIVGSWVLFSGFREIAESLSFRVILFGVEGARFFIFFFVVIGRFGWAGRLRS